jgi:undecaprenyl-diphosphatase
MTTLDAIILAIIEGITEYLPVSSTGHMILASTWMGLEKQEFVKNFEVIIQFGAILSVVVLFWRRFLVSKKMISNLLFAFLPTATIGFILRNHIDELLGSPYVVAWSLAIGGLALIASDKIFPPAKLGGTAEALTTKQCVILGVIQSIAMIPGVSRSAATLLGGMGLGLSRKEAAEFSFLLAVPTLGAATCYKTFKMWQHADVMPDNAALLILLASVISFIVAIFAIRFFISLLQRFGLSAYGYYRIALGGLILYLLMTGVHLD